MDSVASQRVRETVLTANRSAAVVYSVVVFEDGGWGVARNGRPMPGHYWPAEGANDCITAFMEVAGLSGGAVGLDG